MEEGRPVARIIASKGTEVAVFAAVPVRIDGDRLVAWMRRIEELKKSTYVLAIHRFSDPPRLEDLADLSLDHDDASELATCRPGHCDLKLSAAEMTALQTVAAQPDALRRRFRQIVWDRVNAYLAGDQIGPYADTASEVWPGEEFDRLLEHSSFLVMHASSLAESLRHPRRTSMPRVESFLYWSKENLGGKPTVSVTDVHIVRGDGANVPEVIVAGKQIFATHYINASLGVTALVRGEPGSSSYLVCVNRSEVDVLNGKLAGIVRWFVQRRLRAEAGGVLDGLRDGWRAVNPRRWLSRPHPNAAGGQRQRFSYEFAGRTYDACAVRNRSLPSRFTSNNVGRPSGRFTAARSCSTADTGWRLTSSMTSPG